MVFAPQVNIVKYNDRLTVLVRQRYLARGKKSAFRWVYANWFSLKKLEQIEKEPYKSEAG